jgi:hypothetical protein
MRRYIVTSKAGPWVAGTRNNGVGTILELTAAQAEHEVRLGTIVPALETPQILAYAEPSASAANAADGELDDESPLDIAQDGASMPADQKKARRR